MSRFPAGMWIPLGAVLGVAGCSQAVNQNDNGSANGNLNDNAMNENDNTNVQLPDLEAVDTQVLAEPFSPVRASERYIAFGGPGGSDDTSIPKVYDTQTGTVYDVDNAALGYIRDFALSGSHLILRGENQDIYHFDAEDPDSGPARVGLVRIALNRGFIDTDGGNIIAFVTTEPFICWVDLTDEPLFIRTFGRLETSFYSHVSVNGSRIAFLDGSDILVQDTANPFTAPTTFAVGADNAVAIDYDGTSVIYVDESTGEVSFLDVGSGTTTSSGIGYAGGNLALMSQTACMFSNTASYSNAGGTVFPSVVTTVGADTNTAADLSLGTEPSPGWGLSCAVSADGSMVFTAGEDDPAGTTLDILSLWVDGELAAELNGRFRQQGVSAVNVTTGNGLAAYLLFVDGQTLPSLGYIELP